jgi:subtilisin-like proprotein convertase family protein
MFIFMQSNQIKLWMLGCILALSSALQAQTGYWKSISAVPAAERDAVAPIQSAKFEINKDILADYLRNAPMEFTGATPLSVEIPAPDGILRIFQVCESPVMAPELKAKYPGIRTYSGKAADGSGDVVRLDVGPQGVHAYVYKYDGKIQVVSPVNNRRGGKYHEAYRMEDLPADAGAYAGGSVRCGVVNDPDAFQHFDQTIWQAGATDRDAAPVTLKKYRIAISTTGEYSQYYGGSIPAIMNAMVTALNFIVGIQERDFAVRMEMVPNNDTLIFLDPDTDPFTGDLTNWIGQNHLTVNLRIGSPNYDIGHVFSLQVPASNLAGLAGGRVCNVLGKGRGGSSAYNPSSVYFYGVAAHEICHQMSGSHTWNTCTPDIATQRAGQAAYEPGSGSTIMSYAGSCGSNNVVGNNDSETYYHSANIDQVYNFVYEDEGSGCGTLVTTDNTPPVAQIDMTDGFYIPISTPFQLTGSGSDVDNDALTYCWEQFDLGAELPLGQAQGTSPLFRSYFPTNVPTRVFPRIQTIVTNSSSLSELLPTYSRSLTFRLTVRDNHAGGGGVAKDQVQFFATAQAGPFLVTYPNTSGTSWEVGAFQTITWDVANTDKSPVNCQTVNIKLSTDGGFTYPVTLASGVPNTGKYCVQVPNNVTSLGRIRVEAANNIFFDISNTNLVIKQPQQPSFGLCAGVLVDKTCLPDVYAGTISTVALQGFNAPITMNAVGLPSGATATFSPNPVAPGQNTTMTLEFDNNTPESTYSLTVQGEANGNTATSQVLLTVVSNDFSSFGLQTPVDGATGVDIGPSFHWSTASDANTYDIEVATNPSFAAGTIVASKYNVTIDSFQVTTLLPQGQVYYWHVRPNNECGSPGWSEPYVFATKVQNCNVFTANDLPKPISTGTPTVESKIGVNLTGILSDVNVDAVGGNHNFFKDLEARLISPSGTQVLLWKDKCPQSFSFNFGFDDAAPNVFNCPPASGFVSKPSAPLSVLNGEQINGQWTLRIKDNVSGNGGNLTAFALELCSSSALSGPFIVNNNPLSLPGGTNALITTDLLKVDDSNTPPAALTYTLLTIPDNGILDLGGFTLKVGDQFPQLAIDEGALRYFDYGLNLGADDFRFAVTDGDGGMVSGTFVISPLTSVQSPDQRLRFALVPNPANDVVRLNLSEGLADDTQVQLYNMAGQLLRQWQLPAGATVLSLNTSELPDGLYTVSVRNAQVIGTDKLVISRMR